MDSPECFQLNIFKFPKAHSNLDFKKSTVITDGALPEGDHSGGGGRVIKSSKSSLAI